MQRTSVPERSAPKSLRPIEICENYEVVAELDAFNLRDALNRFSRNRPWFENTLITGNVLTVEDVGEQRQFYSRDKVRARLSKPDEREAMSLIRQGDVLIVPADTVPAATKSVARENGRLILAHGEATGHAHAIVDESAELVTADGANDLYLLVHGLDPVSLVHDEHDTLAIAPGTYRVIRQREYAPQGLRNVAD